MSTLKSNKTNYGAVSMLTMVFFFWGFIAAGNSVFIPFCKHYFSLDQFQSQLVDFAFYSAYYLGALALFVVGSMKGRDLIGSWGYKKSIVYGLIFSALGAGAMIVSVYMNVFTGMLLGLFIVALGFSLQQSSANPFMISLGDEKTGSNRINLGGGINSLGTTVGPLIIALALFGSTQFNDSDIANLELSSVIILYACVGALFLLVAFIFGLSRRVPSGKTGEANATQSSDEIIDDPNTTAGQSEISFERAPKAMRSLLIVTGLLIASFAPVFYSYRENIDWSDEYKENIRVIGWGVGLVILIAGLLISGMRANAKPTGWGAMQYPQLTLGMLAIFVYVGVEVSIGSNISELLAQKEFGSISTSQAASYVAMFWGSLMIGRWTGAIKVFHPTVRAQMILRFIVPLVAFGLILLLAWATGYDVKPFFWYVVCVIIQIGAFYLTNDRPALTLGVFGFLGVVAMVTGLMTEGSIAIYAFLSGGLACSIMWPCIFSLSLAGLGKYQTQGAAFLVMMILGGAVIPPLQGKLADVFGIHESFIVGVICFAYLAAFGLIVRGILRKQELKFE